MEGLRSVSASEGVRFRKALTIRRFGGPLNLAGLRWQEPAVPVPAIENRLPALSHKEPLPHPSLPLIQLKNVGRLGPVSLERE